MNIYLRATTETALTCPTAAAQKRHVISFLEVWCGGVAWGCADLTDILKRKSSIILN